MEHQLWNQAASQMMTGYDSSYQPEDKEIMNKNLDCGEQCLIKKNGQWRIGHAMAFSEGLVQVNWSEKRRFLIWVRRVTFEEWIDRDKILTHSYTDETEEKREESKKKKESLEEEQEKRRHSYNRGLSASLKQNIILNVWDFIFQNGCSIHSMSYKKWTHKRDCVEAKFEINDIDENGGTVYEIAEPCLEGFLYRCLILLKRDKLKNKADITKASKYLAILEAHILKEDIKNSSNDKRRSRKSIERDTENPRSI